MQLFALFPSKKWQKQKKNLGKFNCIWKVVVEYCDLFSNISEETQIKRLLFKMRWSVLKQIVGWVFLALSFQVADANNSDLTFDCENLMSLWVIKSKKIIFFFLCNSEADWNTAYEMFESNCRRVDKIDKKKLLIELVDARFFVVWNKHGISHDSIAFQPKSKNLINIWNIHIHKPFKYIGH